jgi:hypothetical protein
MSQFTTELKVRQMGNTKYYVLLEGFEYHVGEYPSDEVIMVPAGFVTDFASFPRILWPIFPPNGKYGKAAVIHDYCYKTACYSKSRSDKIFLEGMEVLGVVEWKRKLIYNGVVYLGWFAWFKHRWNDKKIRTN